ncbi:MAG: hypothetical protein F6K28_40520 [Microcoleus sp. SIO2G3]|nr:hypothetical protein [Microcoleus sp. SIO2G3]
MGRSVRSKDCAVCHQFSAVLYRVKYEEDGDWTFVCNNCWSSVSQDNPHYLYGGTWKAKKKS